MHSLILQISDSYKFSLNYDVIDEKVSELEDIFENAKLTLTHDIERKFRPSAKYRINI